MIRLSDNRAASAFDDYAIRIASTTNNGLNLDFSQAVNLTIHTDFVMSLIEIKPNIMASGSCDKSIRIWDVSTTNPKVNESKQNIINLDGCINSLANVIINDSTQMIAAASGNATIWIFKLNKTSDLYVQNQPALTGHTASINAIVYDNSTQSLYTGSDDNLIKVWSLNNGLFSYFKNFSGHSDRVITLIIYNKNYLISGSADSLIKVWSLTENKWFKDLKLHTQAVTTLTSFNLLENDYFASGSLDTSIVIWDTVWNNITNSSVHIGQINSIVFFSNSSMMASASTDTKIILWPFMPNMTRVNTLSGHKRQIESVYILQNTLIASASDDNTTKIWDINTGTAVNTLIGHTNNVYVAVGFTYTTSSNQSQLLIATGSKDRSIIIWDQMKFNLIYTLYGHLKSVLAIAPLGGSKIASGSCDKSIIIWSLDPPTELLEVLTGHKSCVNALIPYLKDYIISGSDDGRIILWNWNLQSNVKTIASFNPALNQTVNALASFNNKYLAAALGDGSIQIFSMNDQDIILVRNISAHSNSVLDVKFLNNGNLASASKDKTIKVWDVNTYKNIFINSNHNSSVLCLAVMPNANLVSGSEDKTIQIFNTNLYSNNTIIY